ncbi:RBR-type E3 ubiquitin transferase [Ranunculus cassubicifolius]
MFNKGSCSHRYCSNCMRKHITIKIKENNYKIQCPGFLSCSRFLAPKVCESLIPGNLFGRWMEMLAESTVPTSRKTYCPYKDCSVLLDNDGRVIVTEAECPNCRRMFCAQCKVPWHAGRTCKKFQKSNKETEQDAAMIKLAKKKKWKRCPGCKIFVELKNGCKQMTCR